ncbi:MAG: hypothetical protein Q7U23_17475 [Methylococcales bacterium]|nr:hypothetical protein [Methylococcales bacterium]
MNLCEVVGQLIRDDIDLLQQLERTAIKVIPFTHTLYAANFIPQTQRYGLSLGKSNSFYDIHSEGNYEQKQQEYEFASSR